MDFILYFILRDFVPVQSKQNVFVAPELGFSSVEFIGTSLELYRRGPDCVVRHFDFCFVLCCLIYSV